MQVSIEVQIKNVFLCTRIRIRCYSIVIDLRVSVYFIILLK